jgi:hypothetical protein
MARMPTPDLSLDVSIWRQTGMVQVVPVVHISKASICTSGTKTRCVCGLTVFNSKLADAVGGWRRLQWTRLFNQV